MSNSKQLWKEFDISETDKLNLEKMHLCQEMLKIVEGDKKKEMELELNIIWLFHGLHWILQDTKDIDNNALTARVEFFINKCDKRALEYYKRRKDETCSLLNRSRYNRACWWISRKKGCFSYRRGYFINNYLHHQ